MNLNVTNVSASQFLNLKITKSTVSQKYVANKMIDFFAQVKTFLAQDRLVGRLITCV